MRRTLALAFASTLVSPLLAEPVAVRFPDQTFEAELRGFDPALPDVWLASVSVFAGAGTRETGFQIDILDDTGAQTCAEELVEGSRQSHAGWIDGPYCNQPYPDFGLLLTGADYCAPCDWTPGYPTELLYRGEVVAFFLRVREDASSPDWTYGWVAVQGVVLENLTCNPDCGGWGADVPYANFIAAGFADEPNTPVPAGTGLCASDLNFDGTLDLADIQLFVENFLDGWALADRNADGVYDLADVQGFVGGFVAGCP